MIDKLGNLWPAIPAIIVPVIFARMIFRGTWHEIFKSYGLWIALLAVFGFATGGSHGEGYGWALIVFLIYSVIAIPLLVLVQKLWKFASAKIVNSR